MASSLLTFPAWDRERIAAPPLGFLEELEKRSIAAPAAAVSAWGGYVQLLGAANAVTNLTAVEGADRLWTELVLDSLELAADLATLPAGARVLDVGTGGGVPGIPLAIAFPSLQFSLLDATAKKVRFLEHVVRELGLGNVQPVHGRAEDGARGRTEALAAAPLREQFDVVLARALARLPMLLELTIPFAKPPAGKSPGGRVVLVKGEQAAAELDEARNALRLLYAEHRHTRRTPSSTVLTFAKLRGTPNRFPRGQNQPKRNPL